MKRALIFANGELPEPEAARRRLRPDDLLIAADGGARHCRTLGRQPQLVIGDLDSLPTAERAALEAAGVPFERHRAEKDETDLELALLAAVRAGADQLAVLGALGGRLDMTLANVLLLTHPAFANVRVELWHGRQTAWLIRPPGAGIAGQAGDTLSLIPLNGDARGVTLTGLAYPLRDETLLAGPARGVSNTLTGPAAQVTVRAGLLLAVHTPGRAPEEENSA
jgi:thiamine pyrophosphokinase